MKSQENRLEEFTNLYEVSKTLRFALEPVGKTREHIEEKGLLAKDEKLAEDYKKTKKIIDEYHKWFIDDSLSNFDLPIEDLKSFQETGNSINERTNKLKKLRRDKKNNKEQEKELSAKKDELEKLQTKMRKSISKAFDKTRLFNKQFIKEDLPKMVGRKP